LQCERPAQQRGRNPSDMKHDAPPEYARRRGSQCVRAV
jgi:hypothetical protein